MLDSKKIIFIWIAILFCLPTMLFADTTTLPFGIQYISPSQNGYDIHMTNGGNDLLNFSLFVDSEQKNDIQKVLNGDVLKIPDFLKSSADIKVQKTVDASTEISSIIKIRKEDKTMFDQKITTTNISGKDMTLIWFKNPITNFETISASTEKKYSININGTNNILIKNLGNTVYENGKYYINDKYVIFPSVNLTTNFSVVKLLIDGVYSNYVVIQKEVFKLEKPVSFEYKDDAANSYINWIFQVPYSATYIQNYDFYLNGTKLDKNKVTIYLNKFTIDYPISSLIAGNGITEIYIKDPSTNNISNTVYLKTDDYVGLDINKVNLGDGKNTNFQFIIGGDDSGYVGNIIDFSININGTDYSRLGSQVQVTNSDGTVKKDIFGNIMYTTKYNIDLKKEGSGLSFNFYYSIFKDGENIIYLKNNFTKKTSNKISFTKGNYSNINYSYGISTEKSNYSENISFNKGSEVLSKKTDFLNTPITNIILGKIGFNNLSSSTLYNISFKIKSNQKINPFKDILLNNKIFIPKIESDGVISYIYNYTGLGNTFSSDNILVNLNEYYNIDGNEIKLNIEDFIIKTIGAKTDSNIYVGNNSYPVNISYKYEFGNCFDGGKDYCSLAGLYSPYILFNLTYSEAQTQISSSSTNNTTSIIKNTKKNITKNKFLILTNGQKTSIDNRIKNFSTDEINTIIKKIEILLTKNLSSRNRDFLTDIKTILEQKIKN